MSRTPFLDREIWRLKNEDLKIIPKKKKTVPPSLMDSPLEQKDLKIENLFRLAKSDVEFDLLINIQQGFKKWLDAGNEGSTEDYLNSLSIDELKELSLKEGGLVDKRNLPKEPADVKKIDLMGDFHHLMDMLKNMSPQQRRSIQWLVDKTFGKKK